MASGPGRNGCLALVIARWYAAHSGCRNKRTWLPRPRCCDLTAGLLATYKKILGRRLFLILAQASRALSHPLCDPDLRANFYEFCEAVKKETSRYVREEPLTLSTVRTSLSDQKKLAALCSLRGVSDDLASFYVLCEAMEEARLQAWRSVSPREVEVASILEKLREGVERLSQNPHNRIVVLWGLAELLDRVGEREDAFFGKQWDGANGGKLEPIPQRQGPTIDMLAEIEEKPWVPYLLARGATAYSVALLRGCREFAELSGRLPEEVVSW